MHLVPNPATLSEPARANRRGFTLIEILIVVVILGILAAMVVPQFTSAASETRENSLKMDLFRVRQQLAIYQQQHDGSWPSVSNFADQLTKSTKTDGTTAPSPDTPYRWGPYLKQVPVNPFTGGDTVADAALGNSDWFYDPSTGDFRANDSIDHRKY